MLLATIISNQSTNPALLAGAPSPSQGGSFTQAGPIIGGDGGGFGGGRGDGGGFGGGRGVGGEDFHDDENADVYADDGEPEAELQYQHEYQRRDEYHPSPSISYSRRQPNYSRNHSQRFGASTYSTIPQGSKKEKPSENDIHQILADSDDPKSNEILTTREKYKSLLADKPKLEKELKKAKDRKKKSLFAVAASLILMVVLSVSLLSVAPGSGSESIIESLKPDPSPPSTAIDSSSASSASQASTAGTSQASTAGTSQASTAGTSQASTAGATKAVAESAKTASSLSTTMSVTNAMIAYNFTAIAVALPFISLVVSAFFALNAHRKAEATKKEINFIEQVDSTSKSLDLQIQAHGYKKNLSHLIPKKITDIRKESDDNWKSLPSTKVRSESFARLLGGCLGRSSS